MRHIQILIALIVVGLGVACAPATLPPPIRETVPVPQTVVVRQTEVVPQTVVVSRTVVVTQTVAVPQTVIVQSPTVSTPVTTTVAPPKEAFQVLEKWTKAFTDSDVDRIVKLYAPDALFFGTASKTLITKPADVRAYFENALLNNRPRGAKIIDQSVMVVSDNVVVVTGLDTLTGVQNGTPTTANGRFTFVIAKRSTDWQIVHFHRSPLPN